jgi:hypothetical protein
LNSSRFGVPDGLPEITFAVAFELIQPTIVDAAASPNVPL